MVLEGPLLVEEAVRSGLTLEVVLVTEAFLGSPAGRHLSDLLPHPPLLVDPDLLEDVSDLESSRGVLAVAREVPCDPDRLRAAPLLLYVDGVQDPGNLGALARVAEAAGAEGLVLGPGTARAEHPRALRGSAGSLLRLPVRSVGAGVPVDLGDRRWVGLVAHGGESLWAVDLEGPLIVVAGGEGAGLRPEIDAHLDLRVTIPLGGRVESLNVAVATGIVLFERTRRRSLAPPPLPG